MDAIMAISGRRVNNSADTTTLGGHADTEDRSTASNIAIILHRTEPLGKSVTTAGVMEMRDAMAMMTVNELERAEGVSRVSTVISHVELMKVPRNDSTCRTILFDQRFVEVTVAIIAIITINLITGIVHAHQVEHIGDFPMSRATTKRETADRTAPLTAA